MSEHKVSRRRFLAIAGGVVGVTVGACAGGVLVGLREPSFDRVKLNCGKESQMATKVLVAYASKTGTTGEVAEAIGKALCESGAQVDVLRVQEVKDLSAYSSVIIGSAARIGKVLPEALSFARKHQAALASKKAAYFLVCGTMKENTPENRATAAAYLKPLAELQTPVSMGLFGGAIIHARFSPLLRLILAKGMPEVDYRDWDAIRAWGRELAGTLGVTA
jgi:menaquinone-dependent protoporphyrinogen oxidase